MIRDNMAVKWLQCVALQIVLILFSPAVPAADDYEFARLISSEEVVYPHVAEVRGWEGWVYVSYSIGKDGRVKDIEILDSNGVEQLNQAFIESLKSRVYEPAKLNGAPVEQVQDLHLSTFLLTGKRRAASEAFYRKYKWGRIKISEGNFDEARTVLKELSQLKRYSLYEELYLQSLYYAYFMGTGDSQRAYTHAKRVIDFLRSPDESSKKKLVENDFFIPYLAGAYEYEVNKLMLGNAMKNASRLASLAPDDELVKRITEHSKHVLKQVVGKPHAVKMTLPEPVYGGEQSQVYITLLKKEVELLELKGRLDKIVLYCEKGIRKLEYAPGRGWIIPGGWGTCGLAFDGPVGTTFTLAELPDGSLAVN